MPHPPTPPTAAELVRQGWDHLQFQRPLAAWASWQQALRVAPDDPAAAGALERLAGAADLPAAARAVYRFQPPGDPARRASWDEHLRAAGNLDDLGAALAAFEALTKLDPDDSDAWLNRALCLAWLGRNTESVAALERVVRLLAVPDAARASDAWTIAEVLRLGAGAEALADDVRYAWILPWSGGAGPPEGFFGRWPNLYRVGLPVAHEGDAPLPEARVFEWLDRPLPAPGSTPSVDDLPRVIAALIQTPRLLRVSSPDPTGFAVLDDDPKYAEVARVLSGARRERSPLGLAQADAALGTFKIPPGLDAETRAALSRSVIETYYEDHWIHLPRVALDGRSPLAASRAAGRGDAVARAKLAGVVRFREQLGTRPDVTAVYQGYPFDRLRRRLGLMGPAENPGSLDPADASAMSEAELDRLDPPALDDATLSEAFRSAVAFRDDARLARLAAVLAGRESSAIQGVGLPAVFAPLVREALREDDPDRALGWLTQALGRTDDPATRRTFTVWSAEVLARAGRPDASLAAYRSLLDLPENAADAHLALDGAETLLDCGHPAQAVPLLAEARSRAALAGDVETLRLAELLLERENR